MTVSNVHTFTLNRNQIIREALELTGQIDINSPTPVEILESCALTLNLYAKSWQAKGLCLHTYKPATLFLAKDQQSYLLGPTGDNVTESYVETTLSTDVAAAGTVLAVGSETGILVGDKVGVVLDDGTLHWDVAASLAPLTLVTGLASEASSGNAVYAYTTKIIRPNKISDVRTERGGEERPLTTVSISEYKAFPSKGSSSSLTQYAFDPQLDNDCMYVWPVASDVTEKVLFQFQKPVDDFTTDEDTATMPVNWLHCFVTGLAYHISPKLALPLADQAALKARYEDLSNDLDDFEETSMFFAPGSW